MTAFQGAVDLGYLYIETDVHVTRDGVVILFHDDDLDHLTSGAGKAWEWRWEDLKGLDAAHHFDSDDGYPLRGTGIRIPTLEEAVTTFPEGMFNLDLKQAGIEETVAAEVARLGLTDRVLIGSFYDKRVRHFRSITGGRVATAAGPAEVTAALGASLLGRAAPATPDAYQIPEKVATARFVKSVHAAGGQVHVWTINDEETMHRLLDRGVDGIVSDRPDLLDHVLEGRS